MLIFMLMIMEFSQDVGSHPVAIVDRTNTLRKPLRIDSAQHHTKGMAQDMILHLV